MLIPSLISLLLAWVLLLWSRRQAPHEQAAQLRQFVQNYLTVCEEVAVVAGNRGLLLPDLVTAAQKQLDYRLKQDAVRLKFELKDDLPTRIKPATETKPIPGSMATATVDNSTVELNNREENGQIESQSPEVPSEPQSLLGRTLELLFYDVPDMWVDLVEPRTILVYNLEQVHQNDVPFYMSQALYDVLLEPDLKMWQSSKLLSFADYRQEVTVNFVAAEESSESPQQILDSINTYMKRYEFMAPFLRIQWSVQVLDVSKRRAARHLTHNTTQQLTFFYLTSLKPYADAVQGVPLYHVSPAAPESPALQDHYGTQYEAHQKRLKTTVYNMTSFFSGVSKAIGQFVYLPESSSMNLSLRAASLMKHTTLKGIEEVLTTLLERENFEPKLYHEICTIVDSIASNQKHDWPSHLQRVYKVFHELEAQRLKNEKTREG
ncbi:hypothetical protein PUMCH_003929 [Australozyma saopauloensis]|uniref:Uncharacterized protein n=1 Tax=Australozyma saopauloensis TaxID=291208 RepID=A0AAX4HDT4_9ASCO|nr:hypothetical protein PUMCH_003929 [[Candida] saopauloensis]